MADGSVVIQVTADDKDAQKKLNDLRRAIDKTEKAIDTTGGKKAAITEQLEQARKEAEATAREINEIQAQKRENDAVLSGQTGDVSLEEFEARRQAQDEINVELQTQQKLLASQEAAVAKLEAKEREKTAQLELQTAQLEQQKAAAGEVERVIAAQASSAMPQLSAATEQVSKSMRKGFRNILKWGFGIRSVFILVRRLRSAIKEGVNAFAEQDEETKNTITSLKTALQTLKVSWGAAFAPILNAVAPILQKLIGWLTTAANAVQQFFAILGGKTTYKAVKANEALADSYGGAGAAAEKAEKQLMGFDEINKLNAESSGGGGGGGGDAGDIAQQFEDIPILESFKKHLDDILIIVGLIGSALLAWRLSKVLPFSFIQIFGVLMAIIGLVQLVKSGLDAWNNGVNWGNFFDMLKGAALLVGGLALAFGKTGAAIGLLVGGIALLVVGLKDWITTGELSTEAFYALEAGILAVGAAIALLTGNWIPLIIAAVVGLVLAIYKHWDEIKAWWQENVVAKFKEGGEELRQDWERTKESVRALKDNIVRIFGEIRDGIKTKIDAARDAVREAIDRIKEFFRFEWKLPEIKMPHITVSWEALDGNNPIAKLLGIGSIPHLGIQWYARGGIVDGATLIGAGEAGKEAIVPLERNTEWIQMVADGLVDRLTSNNRLSDYVSRMPIPALVGGQVVPPRALSNSGSVFTDGDIQRLVSGLTAALSGDGGFGETTVKLYLDGRQIAENVSKHQRQMERGR